MKRDLTCHVSGGTTHSNVDDKTAWVRWLKDKNPDQTGYNMHDLWLWYGSKVMAKGADEILN